MREYNFIINGIIIRVKAASASEGLFLAKEISKNKTK